MAGGWGLLVELCLPVPFVLLILLTVPAPRSFNRTVLTLVDRTLGVRFGATLSSADLGPAASTDQES